MITHPRGECTANLLNCRVAVGAGVADTTPPYRRFHCKSKTHIYSLYILTDMLFLMALFPHAIHTHAHTGQFLTIPGLDGVGKS